MTTKEVPSENPITGWAQGATINPPQTLTPAPKGQKSYTMQCQLTPSRTFTVQFFIGPPADPKALNNPVAKITWSVNGNQVVRKVSAINGMSLTGVGEAVHVEVTDESTPKVGSPYASSTTVALGSRGGSERPTLQNQASQTMNSGGGTATFPIEQGVGVVGVRMLVWGGAGATLNLDKFVVTFLDGAGSVIEAYQNPNVNGFVNIPPNAASVVVTNNDAVNASARPVFSIDG